jgi:ATP-dependent Clp protease protease subunit
MQQRAPDYLSRLGIIAALLACAYMIRTHQNSQVNFENLTDHLVDAGFNFPESQQELELLEQRKILITTDINAHSSRSVIQKLLILNARDANAPIDLYLRTEGGWEPDAFSVIDTMHSTTAPVNVHAIGGVHSAGLMITTTATGQRIAYQNTIFGYHSLDDDETEEWEKRYLKLWETHGKLPNEWIEQRDDEMLYFTAKDAIKYGVADQLVESKPNQ